MNKYLKGTMGAGLAVLAAVGLAACSNAGTPAQQQSNAVSSATPAASAMAEANTPAAQPMQQMASSSATQPMNWFGGPIYNGEPALAATAALVKAGGGADNFKFSTALVAMLGQDTVNAEVAKLNKQYGEESVKNFLAGMTFAINDSLKRATEKGIKLPEPPADLTGTQLAGALVDAGTAPDGTFWAGYMFDKAISHPLHNLVMADIDAKYSHAADENTHRILNQAMYDVAQALGKTDVKLASLH